ncbi:MAG TPA: serine/threonine-protein kinase [Pyrinomonadaceae bacterium]|nr:serine/threonine-protein kinase [Pyrinomonadaceae bacterium]
MTPERWQQVEEVLQNALDLPWAERATFIAERCGNDRELKDEASSLLDAHEDAGNFIETPALAQDAHILLGDTAVREVGQYSIIRALGSGGMGEVYLAQDRRLDRLVALKILPSYFAADDQRLRRFQREARAASALNHPNILTIHEVGESDGTYFIATEFIDGQTIREITNSERLTTDEVMDIVEQVATGLAAAHRAGIVHRDIKPENIMRRTDGLVKILDFGIAKLLERQDSDATQRSVHTELGVVMGTVDYMSPEQARGLPVDERTDIWSLGVVLYEMLARRLPFAGATRMDSMVAILEREPLLLEESINEALRTVVETCLQKDRDKRYQSIDELLADLRAARELPASQSQLLDVRPHRTRNLVLLAAAWLLVAVAAAAFVYRAWRPGVDPAPASQPAASKTYMQMSDTEKIAFIREQEQRVAAMMGEHPVQLNDEAVRYIQRYVDRYVAMGREPGASGEATIEAIYSRAKSHVPRIARSFSERKVPVIIGIYLPVIESGYRNCFENSLGAKGLYQFLPSTAKIYGVNQDEMCDVEKMTPAAAHYIADLMAELGEDSQSLTLVLVSYNRGAESVRTSLRELRGSQNYQRNFWTLFANRHRLDETFRNESVGYVPAFFAVAIIGENPESFGLPGPPLSTLANESARAPDS